MTYILRGNRTFGVSFPILMKLRHVAMKSGSSFRLNCRNKCGILTELNRSSWIRLDWTGLESFQAGRHI